MQIYVVDSLDRERIGKAKAEFQTIISDPFMLNSVILVFANKQDMVRNIEEFLWYIHTERRDFHN